MINVIRSVGRVFSVILLDHLVDELVEFISIEVSTSNLSDLLIDLLTSVGDELGKSESSIDLRVPLSEVLDVSSVEVG